MRTSPTSSRRRGSYPAATSHSCGCAARRPRPTLPASISFAAESLTITSILEAVLTSSVLMRCSFNRLPGHPVYLVCILLITMRVACEICVAWPPQFEAIPSRPAWISSASFAARKRIANCPSRSSLQSTIVDAAIKKFLLTSFNASCKHHCITSPLEEVLLNEANDLPLVRWSSSLAKSVSPGAPATVPPVGPTASAEPNISAHAALWSLLAACLRRSVGLKRRRHALNFPKALADRIFAQATHPIPQRPHENAAEHHEEVDNASASGGIVSVGSAHPNCSQTC